jgi:hypothetical protein
MAKSSPKWEDQVFPQYILMFFTKKDLRPEDIRKDSPFVFLVFRFSCIQLQFLIFLFSFLPSFHFNILFILCCRYVSQQTFLFARYLAIQALSIYGMLMSSGPHRPVWFLSRVSVSLLLLSFTFLLGGEDAFPSDTSLEGDNRVPRCLVVCGRNLSQMCNASIALSRSFSKLLRTLQADFSIRLLSGRFSVGGFEPRLFRRFPGFGGS